MTMRSNRPLLVLATALALAAVPAAAAAHAELESSDPAPGETLDVAPTEVVLTFSGELDPASGFVVTDHHGEEVGAGELDLDVAERNVLRGSVAITEPGVYTVTWTGVSIDGHPEEGTFAFGYQAEVTGEPSDGDHHGEEGESPDTALAAEPPMHPALPAGIATLLVATALGVRRLVLVAARRRA
jgi:methionine-rich copper-binding protein CopC